MELNEIIDAVNKHRNETDKKVFELRCDGYSYEKIGDLIHQSEDYARRRMFEIRKFIKKYFKQ